MASNEMWCQIDNHPGVFTALVKKMGVTGMQIEELWSMDDAVIDNLKPVHGLIFIYKTYPGERVSESPIITDQLALDTIYFATQVINNARATQALINVLFNLVSEDFRLGAQLRDLKEASLSYAPNRRGLALGNHENIRAAQNSLSPRQFFGYDIKVGPYGDEDLYNFVGYMPIDGRLYELDMKRDGPVDHGPISPEQDWLNVVHPIIQKRIEACNNARVDFNIMAFITDQRMLMERELFSLTNSQDLMNPIEYKEEHDRLMLSLEFENVKLHRYREEMARKRHDYVPVMLEELKNIGREELDLMCKQAKNRANAINRVSRLYEEGLYTAA